MEELDITASKDVLRVSGRRNLPGAGGVALRLEIPSGGFFREIRFDGGVRTEDVTAALSRGILSVRLPKSSPARIRVPVDPPSGGSADR